MEEIFEQIGITIEEVQRVFADADKIIEQLKKMLQGKPLITSLLVGNFLLSLTVKRLAQKFGLETHEKIKSFADMTGSLLLAPLEEAFMEFNKEYDVDVVVKKRK